eukprot:3430086-Rhodomonas_salina.1
MNHGNSFRRGIVSERVKKYAGSSQSGGRQKGSALTVQQRNISLRSAQRSCADHHPLSLSLSLLSSAPPPS